MTINAVDFFSVHVSSQVLDNLPVAVTVTDPEGHIVYFNKYSTQVLDRKPEYLGRDIRFCHQKPESIGKIDKMLERFKSGNKQEVSYETTRYGKRLAVTFSPLFNENNLIGCIQTVTIRS